MFAQGRWWTVLTGPFFAVVPLYYLPMTGTFALLVGATEWRLGTRVAAVTAVVGQVAVVVASAGLLLALRATGWEWATSTARLLDVGFSAGALACAALLSGVLRPPWRLRIRLYLPLYVLASFVYLGSLADVEHLLRRVPCCCSAGRSPPAWAHRRRAGPPVVSGGCSRPRVSCSLPWRRC